MYSQLTIQTYSMFDIFIMTVKGIADVMCSVEEAESEHFGDHHFAYLLNRSHRGSQNACSSKAVLKWFHLKK